MRTILSLMFVLLFPLRPTLGANRFKHTTLQSLRELRKVVSVAPCDTFTTRSDRSIRNLECCVTLPLPLPCLPLPPPKGGTINPLIAESGLLHLPFGASGGSHQRKQSAVNRSNWWPVSNPWLRVHICVGRLMTYAELAVRDLRGEPAL